MIHLMLRRTEAGARLSASSRLPHLDEMPAEGGRVGEIAKAIADRLVAQIDVHVPATEPRIEPVEHAQQFIIERERDLERKVTVDVVDERHEQTRLPDFWVVWR